MALNTSSYLLHDLRNVYAMRPAIIFRASEVGAGQVRIKETAFFKIGVPQVAVAEICLRKIDFLCLAADDLNPGDFEVAEIRVIYLAFLEIHVRDTYRPAPVKSDDLALDELDFQKAAIGQRDGA